MQAYKKTVFKPFEGTQEMSNAQWNAFLELLALAIEAKALTPKEAAELVRSLKTE